MSHFFYCQQCGQRCDDDAFHPYLYRLLFAGGIEDQAAFLADAGFVREDCAAVGGLQYQNQPRESVNKVAESS